MQTVSDLDRQLVTVRYYSKQWVIFTKSNYFWQIVTWYTNYDQQE